MPPKPVGISGLSRPAMRSPISSSAQSPRHPLLGAEHVHRQRHRRLGTRGSADLLEQQCRALRPHDPLNDFGDLQVRVDRHPDPLQLAAALQAREHVGQVEVGHPPIFSARGRCQSCSHPRDSSGEKRDISAR